MSEVLGVPLVRKPIYPHTYFPSVDDIMSLLCGRPVSWGTEPRINSCEFTELNSLYLRISCHNIYAISHVHTIPINRCAFLYASVTDVSKSTSKGQKLWDFEVFRVV